MKQLALLLLLLAPAKLFAAESSTAVPGAAPPTGLRLPTEPKAAPASLQSTDASWQRKYDAALERRRSGLRKVVIGLVMEGAGIAMVVAGGPGEVTCTYYTCEAGSNTLQNIGTLTALGGAVPFWWGAVQWIGANGDVHSLEAMRPRDARVSVPLSEHQQLVVDAGRQVTVGYGVTW